MPSLAEKQIDYAFYCCDGVFNMDLEEAEECAEQFAASNRLIDTARIYGNEAAVGRGLQRAIDEEIVTREDVFITTKMWTDDYSEADAAIDASLERLDVDYIDLMILHHSQPGNDVDAYNQAYFKVFIRERSSLLSLLVFRISMSFCIFRKYFSETPK